MGGSPFYARIKAQLLEIIQAVPAGRVVTTSDIADWLDVPPRHVAFILTKLSPEEEAATPWFRAVLASGAVHKARVNTFGVSQIELLQDEGVAIDPDGRLADFPMRRIRVEALKLALPRQTRPANAPVSSRRKVKTSPKTA
jgi:methylated-DNA-protein-cysteine methyltransferase-like protein